MTAYIRGRPRSAPNHAKSATSEVRYIADTLYIPDRWPIGMDNIGTYSAAVVPRPVPRAGARRARHNQTQITEANHTGLLAPTAGRARVRACRLRDDVARPRVVASEMMSRYSGLHPRVRLRRRCTRTSGLGFARSSLPRGFVRSSLPRGLARSYLPRGFVRSYPSSCGL
jgi:hypothetical protein